MVYSNVNTRGSAIITSDVDWPTDRLIRIFLLRFGIFSKIKSRQPVSVWTELSVLQRLMICLNKIRGHKRVMFLKESIDILHHWGWVIYIYMRSYTLTILGTITEVDELDPCIPKPHCLYYSSLVNKTV